jgi:hypothetical protein
MKLRNRSAFFVLLQFLMTEMGWTQNEKDLPRIVEDELTEDSLELAREGVRTDSTKAGALEFVDPSDLEISGQGGARVALYHRDGSLMYGDLLSVSGSAVSVYVYENSSHAYSRLVHSGAQDFDIRDIDKLVLKGRSRVLQGIFMGFLGGMVAGAVVNRVVKRQAPAGDRAGPGALGGIGLVAGGTVGYLSSGKDLEIRKFEEKNSQCCNRCVVTAESRLVDRRSW